MNVKHTFKQIDASDTVKFHAEERIKKLEPHLTKQVKAHCIYKKIRSHEYWVDIVITGHNKVFRASAKSFDDFYASVDNCIPKIMKQLSKKKDRLQHHRHSEMARISRLERMSPDLEHDFSKINGVGKVAA